MSGQPTKADGSDLPTFAENFTWSMDGGSEIVTAVRPNGQTIKSDARRADRRNPNSPIVATHSLSWPEICDLAARCKNAYQFIGLLDRSAMP